MQKRDWWNRVFVPAEDNLLSLVVWIVVAAQKKVRAVMLRSAGEVICHCLPSTSLVLWINCFFLTLSFVNLKYLDPCLILYLFFFSAQSPMSSSPILIATLAKFSFLFAFRLPKYGIHIVNICFNLNCHISSIISFNCHIHIVNICWYV